MTPHRTVLRSIVAATGLLAIAAPAFAITPAIQSAAPPAASATGTAASTSVPLSVTVDGVVVDVGATVLSATNDTDVMSLAPWAGAGVTLLNVAGARFGDLEVRSDGATANNGMALERDTAIGAVGASVADLLATADAATNSATARLGTLTTDATVLEGLGLTATVTDVVATADDTGASASHTLAVAGIDLDLADVLGPALDGLSLGQLLELAEVLDGLDLPAGLDIADDLATAIEDLVASIDAARVAAGAVDDAAAALLAADLGDALTSITDLATTTALRDALAAAAGSANLAALATIPTIPGVPTIPTPTVPTTTTTIPTPTGPTPLTPTTDPLNSLPSDPTTVVPDPLNSLPSDLTDTLALLQSTAYSATGCATDLSLSAALACVQAHLDELTSDLADLTPLVADLQGAVAEYLSAVNDAQAAAGLLDGITDLLPELLAGLLDDIAALIDDVLGTELLSLGDVQVTQQVRAVGDDLDASSATVVCEATTVAVLGGDPLALEDCSAPGTTLATIEAIVEGALGDVLTVLGGVDVGDGVGLELFGTVENATSETDGIVTATSSLEVLSLTLPEVTITPCDVAVVGAATCLLLPTLDGALGDTLSGLTGTLGSLQQSVSTVLDDTQLLALLSLLDVAPATIDVADADGVGALIDATLGLVASTLDGLNLDGVLAGEAVRILPQTSVVIDPQLEARHGVTAAGAPADPAPTPDAPNGAPTPSDPALPNTGGGAALLAVLALGAGTWLWRRKETGEA